MMTNLGLCRLCVVVATLLATACGDNASNPSLAGANDQESPTELSADGVHSITVNGQPREYLLHVPQGVAESGEASLFLLFHGQSSRAQEVRDYTAFDDFADNNQVIAVYPESLRGELPFLNNEVVKHWDTYFLASDAAFDDMAFVDQLVQQLKLRYQVADHRVFVGGFSNGSAFAQRLICELPNTFAGLVAVGFSAVEQTISRCPALSIPIVFSRGTQDPVAPYQGFGGFALDSDVSVQRYADLNGCETPLAPQVLDDVESSDNTYVTQIDYGDCSGGAVRFYKVENGGHTWPGSPFVVDANVFGLSNNDINFNQVAWQFLQDHLPQ